MSDIARTSKRRSVLGRVTVFVTRLFLIVFGPLVVGCIGAYFYAIGGRIITTDNAYVKSDKILVSSEISGPLTEVSVSENLPVVQGQILIRIDQTPFRIAVVRAEARLDAVHREIEAARAHLREEMAVQKAAEKKVEYLGRELERREELQKRGVTSDSALDSARHEYEFARQSVKQSVEKIGQIMAYLGGDIDVDLTKHPDYMSAYAEREQALFEISRTIIKASTNGVVTNIGLQPGEYVSAGEPLFGIVASDEVWVDANLKETKLTNVKVGQTATIRIDAYPKISWRALVASIGAATGAEFSVLPPQNATGNWVKVVQRVPVRLMILDYMGDPPLRAGMSAVVSIDTEQQREVPEFVRRALARFAPDNAM